VDERSRVAHLRQLQSGLCEPMRPAQVRLVEVCLVEVRLDEACPAEVRSREIRLANLRMCEIRPTEVSVTEVHLAKVGSPEVRPGGGASVGRQAVVGQPAMLRKAAPNAA
jgi:hypothetical protein